MTADEMLMDRLCRVVLLGATSGYMMNVPASGPAYERRRRMAEAGLLNFEGYELDSNGNNRSRWSITDAAKDWFV